MDEGNTLVNALIGGAIMIFGGWIPFVPVVGGAVAGYLQGGSRRDGVRVGAYAGVVGILPSVILATFVGGVIGLGFGLAAFSSPSAGAAGFFGLVIFALVLVIAALYFIGLAAVGGWLGNYVKYDTDVDL